MNQNSNDISVPEHLRLWTRDGKLGHYGDCYIYAGGICDCGLLRTLLGTQWEPLYPKFDEEYFVHDSRISAMNYAYEQMNTNEENEHNQ